MRSWVFNSAATTTQLCAILLECAILRLRVASLVQKIDKLLSGLVMKSKIDGSWTMSRLSELVYARVRSPHSVEENFQCLRNLGLAVSFIIEAGCHDGSDTEKMLAHQGVEKIFAFEPDSTARNIAKSKLARFSPDRLSISSYALMDRTGVFEIDFLSSPGSGSTQVREFIEFSKHEQIQAIRLDDFAIVPTSGGFLWLDVEGAAHEVIMGGVHTLRKLSAMNIEVEFHDMSESRRSNFRIVIRFLRSQGFGIWASDINPGYFGNLFMVRVNLLSPPKRFIMQARYFRLLLLHSFIYPALKKPAKISGHKYS